MSGSMGSGLPPAGWYDDPEQPGQHRYWDGDKWTEQRRPAAETPAPPAMATPGATGGYGAPMGAGSAPYPGPTSRSPELASPWKRLGARIIDIIILGIIAVILFAITGGFASIGDAMTGLQPGQTPDFGGAFTVRIFLISLIVGIGYEVTLTALKGQTVGKMALSLKVVKEETGEVPGWGPAGIRWAVPALANVIPVIGGLLALLIYAAILWDPKNQGWHDKPAKTLVIDV